MELASVKTQSEMVNGNLSLRTALGIIHCRMCSLLYWLTLLLPEIIASVYRVQLGPRFFPVGVQGILNQITLGNLDYVSPIPYTDARDMAITVLSPSIDFQATLVGVDDAMHHLYHKTLKYMHGAEVDPFIIRQDEYGIDDIIAFFTLFHFAGHLNLHLSYRDQDNNVIYQV